MESDIERQNDADNIRRIRRLLVNTYAQEREQEAKRSHLMKAVKVFLTVLGICLFVALMMACKEARADISESKAIACILGEARGEGFASMLAHAEAIRARGTLKGVYGCRANLKKEMPYLEKMGVTYDAARAWRLSKTTSTVKGAQFWGSTIVDQKWIAKMERAGFVRTAKINNTVFYKESK